MIKRWSAWSAHRRRCDFAELGCPAGTRGGGTTRRRRPRRPGAPWRLSAEWLRKRWRSSADPRWTRSTTRKDRQHRSVQFLTIFCYQSDQMWCSLPNIWTVSKPQCASLLLNLWPNTFVFHDFLSLFIFHLLMPCGHFWALELFISIQERFHMHIAIHSLHKRKKHSKRHNGPKALRTLTHSTPLVQSRSFNKL